MATEQEHKVALKLLVHKNENRVIYAEADNHFADILFSLLTLPLGTIIRLLKEEDSDVQPAGSRIGSLTNLYKSVEDLDLKFFSREICKNMLLNPRNDAAAECRRLKVNIDDTEVPKYYKCPNDNCIYISSCRNVTCSCGSLITTCAPYKGEDMNSSNVQAVFFNKSTTLLISDDLSIMLNGPRIIVELFNRFDITDVKLLTKRVVHLGKKEIVTLLKCSLISKTPLTDAFLRTGNQPSEVGCKPSMILPPQIVERDTDNSNDQISLKLLVRKSDNKILFAQANDDFINQIFSLLSVPLGLVVRLLGGNSSFGSVDQLCTSIMSQDLKTYLISPPENKLVNTKLAPHYSSKNQLLPLPIADYDREVCVSIYGLSTISYQLNPKSRDGANEGAFVKSPSGFIVTDDLVVKPISSLVSVAFLERLNIPKNDIEEKVVAFGIDQAYKLLKSSLVSESALTDALMVDLLKIPKEEK